MDANISFAGAFVAGILSFLSPCVLPLLGSYLAFISGLSAPAAGNAQTAPPARRFWTTQQAYVLFCTLFFIAGFTVVFAVLSVLLYGFFMFVSGFTSVVHTVSGVLVIILGLNMMFGFIPFLKYDDSSGPCETCQSASSIFNARPRSLLARIWQRKRGAASAFVAGLAFGAGWTPCVGALLGSILLMAAQTDTMLSALFCLLVYAAGLGIPFVAASLVWGRLLHHTHRYAALLPVIKYASGMVLILVGALIIFGRFTLQI